MERNEKQQDIRRQGVSTWTRAQECQRRHVVAIKEIVVGGYARETKGVADIIGDRCIVPMQVIGC